MLTLHEVEQQLNVWHWGPSGSWKLTVGNTQLAFNPKTLILTWVVMALVALFCTAATRGMNMRRPKGSQNLLEMLFEGILGLAKQNMTDKKANTIITVVVTYFLFILFSNLIGLVPTLSSPTADYNTNLGLALCTFFGIYILGVKFKGLGYFKHYVQPFVFFLPINLIEDLAKPITLTFRLYGNIYGGEVLIAVLLGMLGGWAHLFGGFLASVVWLAFSIFVGFIQAFIFTMLSIAYWSLATAEDHH